MPIAPTLDFRTVSNVGDCCMETVADCHMYAMLLYFAAELRVLVAEVCTHEGTLYARKPDPDRAETQFAAWEKIEQVYGKGRLERFHKGARRDYVLQTLSDDRRVCELLTPQTPGEEFNCHHVEEGSVVAGSDLARAVLSSRSGDDLDVICCL